MGAYRISAVTLRVKDMAASCNFYSRLGLRLAHGGPQEPFTSFEVGSEMYINLELAKNTGSDFGRVIFHVDDVDALFRQMKGDSYLSTASFEDEPRDAPWGERFFHVRDPDGYQLSFAKPL
jgi:catechol 2,3-dioxygenase-like lactoylglutathione lyase family enzyme